jgi:hypothetical protein
MVPAATGRVNFSPNSIIPIIILTIGSNVLSIDAEVAPIIFNALINKLMDIIVETNEIPTSEKAPPAFVGNFRFPLMAVIMNNRTPAESEK